MSTFDVIRNQKRNELGQAELDRIRKEHLQIAQEQARDDTRLVLNVVPDSNSILFPTCQVRVVRFYVSCRSSSSSSPPSPPCLLPDLNHDHPRPVFAAGPQPRPATPSVCCRTSTTTSHAQCSLPDLNHDQPRPVSAAGPQPRPATPSVRCRTSTTTINAQCSLPDLNHDRQRPVFAAGPQLPCQKLCEIECQKICQIECQKICQIECQKI